MSSILKIIVIVVGCLNLSLFAESNIYHPKINSYQISKDLKYLSFSTKLAGFGLVKLKLNLDTYSNEINDSIQIRGILKNKGNKQRIVATVLKINKKDYVVVSLNLIKRKSKKIYLMRLQLPLYEKVNISKLYKQRVLELKNHCAHQDHTNEVAELKIADTVVINDDLDTFKTSKLTNLKELEINLEADKGWYNKYQANSSNMLTITANEADLIYNRDLGIKIKINNINVYKNERFTETQSEILLEDYRNFSLIKNKDKPADVNHFFTTNDLNGSAIGIAYVGATCLAPSFSYGLTQYTSIFTSLTFAHELGHNLSASHSYSGIMGAAVTIPAPENFSSYSINQVDSHIQTYGACLKNITVNEPKATPKPTLKPTPKPTPKATPRPAPKPTPKTTPKPKTDPKPTPENRQPENKIPEIVNPPVITEQGISLISSISKKGEFRAQIKIKKLNTNCIIELKGKNTKIKTDPSRKIVSFSPTKLITVLDAEILSRAKVRNKFGKRVKTYLYADLKCGSKKYTTELVNIDAKRVNLIEKPLSVRKWFILLRSKLSSIIK